MDCGHSSGAHCYSVCLQACVLEGKPENDVGALVLSLEPTLVEKGCHVDVSVFVICVCGCVCVCVVCVYVCVCVCVCVVGVRTSAEGQDTWDVLSHTCISSPFCCAGRAPRRWAADRD